MGCRVGEIDARTQLGSMSALCSGQSMCAFVGCGCFLTELFPLALGVVVRADDGYSDARGLFLLKLGGVGIIGGGLLLPILGAVDAVGRSDPERSHFFA